MKELLNKRINSIPSLEERKVFRDIINHVFMDLVDYQDGQIKALETHIFDEMSTSRKRPVLYGTIIKRNDYDESDDFMFPMSIKDIEPYEMSTGEIKDTLSAGKSYMLGKTFLKCDRKTLEKLYDSGRTFQGVIHTESTEIRTDIRLCAYRSYKEMLEHLYHVFIKNGIEWVTPNLPYIYKFAGFMIDTPIDLPDNECVEKVEVDLEEYEEYRVNDVIPVWNMEKTMIQSINFPIPTFDNVLKEHRFDVYDLPSYHYIPDFQDDYSGYVKRTEKSVSILIPEGDIKEWPMYKIHPYVDGRHYAYPFEIYDNAPAQNFHNGYLNAGNRCVRTRGEIARILYSFKAAEMFKIKEYSIIDSGGKADEADTYPVNDFIMDEIRSSSVNKRNFAVYYTYKYDNSYMAADIMSFIVSELQQYIPDMRCIGIERKDYF